MSIGRYLFRRFLASIIVLFGVSIVIFLMARLIPGDTARIAAGPRATAEMVENIRARLHLDESLPMQYYYFLKGLSEGDLGMSIYTNRAVVRDIAEFFPATFELVLVSGLVMVLVGVPLGILSARYRDGLTDNVARVVALLGVVTPTFVWAIFLMLLFSFALDLLPTIGRLSDGVTPPPRITGLYTVDALVAGQLAVFWDAAIHLILPAVALALTGMGQAARLTRTNMIESFQRPYSEFARAYNFSEREMAFKYALKPAMIPTLTILGLDFAVMLGNAFLVETVFGIGGMARYGIDAIMHKDLNGIIGTVLVIATFFLIVNVVIDLVVAFLNPRVRLA